MSYLVRYNFGAALPGHATLFGSRPSLTEAILSMREFEQMLRRAACLTCDVDIEDALPGMETGFEVIGPASGRKCALVWIEMAAGGGNETARAAGSPSARS